MNTQLRSETRRGAVSLLWCLWHSLPHKPEINDRNMAHKPIVLRGYVCFIAGRIVQNDKAVKQMTRINSKTRIDPLFIYNNNY